MFWSYQNAPVTPLAVQYFIVLTTTQDELQRSSACGYIPSPSSWCHVFDTFSKGPFSFHHGVSFVQLETFGLTIMWEVKCLHLLVVNILLIPLICCAYQGSCTQEMTGHAFVLETKFCPTLMVLTVFLQQNAMSVAEHISSFNINSNSAIFELSCVTTCAGVWQLCQGEGGPLSGFKWVTVAWSAVVHCMEIQHMFVHTVM